MGCHLGKFGIPPGKFGIPPVKIWDTTWEIWDTIFDFWDIIRFGDQATLKNKKMENKKQKIIRRILQKIKSKKNWDDAFLVPMGSAAVRFV